MSSDAAPILLTASAMREADRVTIEEFGVSGLTLMETAGRAVADYLSERFPMAETVGVLCGRGNNAGDGLVAARVLADRGITCVVIMASGSDRLSGESQANYDRLIRMRDEGDAPVTLVDGVTAKATLRDCDVLVDALLGTGISAAPRPPFDTLIGWANEHRAPILAVDIPSGLDADSGITRGAVINAVTTITLGARKAGLFIGNGPDVAGDIRCVEIGIPGYVLRAAATHAGCGHLTGDADLRRVLPRRARGSHKFTSGPVLVIGGSRQYPGAPAMASRAAARAGCGYVVASVPSAATGSGFAVEIPRIALPAGSDGVTNGKLSDELAQWLDRARAVVLGPGLGRGDGPDKLVAGVLAHFDGPVVVDADGLRALAQLEDITAVSRGRLVLTPHAGEMRTLTEAFDADHLGSEGESLLGVAARLARAWNVVLLVKGQPSVVGAPDGRVRVCSTGNPSLASAGTGDILAGVIGGILAQGLSPFDAAAAGVHIGGAAADRYVQRSGRSTLLATDLLRIIPGVIRDRFE